eukprot:5406607-Prymnesium_polylepis.1
MGALKDGVAQVDVHLPAIPGVSWFLRDVAHQQHTRCDRAGLEVIVIERRGNCAHFHIGTARAAARVVAWGRADELARVTVRDLVLVIPVRALDGVRFAGSKSKLLGRNDRALAVACEGEAVVRVDVLLAQAARLHLAYHAKAAHVAR